MQNSVPRRKVEAIYQDVLSEVGPLVDKVEQSIAEANRLLQSAQNLPMELSKSLHQSASNLENQTARELRQMTTKLQSIAESTKQHARFVENASQRMIWLNVLAGGIAGSMGGILAGIALGRYLFTG